MVATSVVPLTSDNIVVGEIVAAEAIVGGFGCNALCGVLRFAAFRAVENI